MTFSKKTVTAPTPDILAQKKSKLDLYNVQFDRAVSLITDTIENLGEISQGISETMREIDDYEKELAATKSGLADAKAKNDKVIANFRSLIAID